MFAGVMRGKPGQGALGQRQSGGKLRPDGRDFRWSRGKSEGVQ